MGSGLLSGCGLCCVSESSFQLSSLSLRIVRVVRSLKDSGPLLVRKHGLDPL